MGYRSGTGWQSREGRRFQSVRLFADSGADASVQDAASPADSLRNDAAGPYSGLLAAAFNHYEE